MDQQHTEAILKWVCYLVFYPMVGATILVVLFCTTCKVIDWLRDLIAGRQVRRILARSQARIARHLEVGKNLSCCGEPKAQKGVKS